MLAIALALGASVCWGSGDFFGGLGTRRASLWAVIVGSQAVGLAGAVLVTLLAGRHWPGLLALWPVLLGGLASVVAISSFYKALAIGSMSVVAPISAASAVIPFLFGLVTGERPGASQLAGVALAAVGVLLVATEPSRTGETIGAAALPGQPAVEPQAIGAGLQHRDRRRAVALALLAAVCIGLVMLGYDAVAEHDPLWAMLGGRASSATVFTFVFLALRPRLRLRRSALPLIAATGIADTAANGLFALATTHGYLSIVAVLGSVYPVVTVALAYVLLRERVAPHQLAGAAGTLLGIALIAAG
ncbi:MAG: DMT family transporter [Thermoleophilia bacterium]